jgi:glycosyltransferase involved in cell wall biosynthesis
MKWQRNSVKNVNKIITISENTKNDLINIWNIPEKKIKVIYLGIEEINLEQFDKKRIYPNPYILFVGQRFSYKNFINYLKAFKILTHTNKDLILVCTGIPFSNSEKRMLYQMGLLDKVIHISASERTMISLYHNAELFVYPSLYEGFGMPLIEAMNCCCPIICSKTSCFPEIAQDAALYFDPYITESMLEITRKVLDNRKIKIKLIENGNKRKKDFSWKKCAEEHIKLYKELFNE